MQPLEQMPEALRAAVRGVLTDIDDTLTTSGRLDAKAYLAMERLHTAGLYVIPITGRPAGWCDHIARMWPVDGVIGENGAFYFRYEHDRRRMVRRYVQGRRERAGHRRRLSELARRIVAVVPGTAVAADQAYRESDLAIDYCEDVAPVSEEAVRRIVAEFEAAGATAKVSSIHVNGWFGDYDKLGMTRRLLEECLALDLDEARERFVFVGDSPNDAPMFAYFPLAVGVANVRGYLGLLESAPAYVTRAAGGDGFAELVDHLLS